MLQSLQLGGTGKTVSLSFDLPDTALDALSNLHRLAEHGAGATLVGSPTLVPLLPWRLRGSFT